jgi:glycosyltransferase involved in cell wall biosynthesis
MCNSEPARRAYRNVLGFPEEKLATVTNAVDVPESKIVVQSHITNPRIGYVANYRPLKRHDLFVASASRIRKRFPGATFHLVGWGIGQHAVEQSVREAGLAECFEFLGEVSDTESFYRNIDLYLHVAEMEGVSNAILEAMGYGIPCVVTNTESNIEIVRHRENGLTCGSSAKDISETVELILKDHALRLSLTEKASMELGERFSPRTLATQTNKEYRRLLEAAEKRLALLPTVSS